MKTGETILSVKGITKLFPGVVALDHVDFDLRVGEVHILVGENGAGKSTLSKCILGAYVPEQGTITLNGTKKSFKSPRDALKEGITAVYQEFTLIPYLSVAQNIFLNREYRKKNGLLDINRMEKESRELLKLINCEHLNVSSHAKDLTIAEQQMVEIAKALSFHPQIIIFDEPTATLSEREVDSLFEQIRKLRASGIGIIYISHKIQEFTQIGDRISVFRDGRKIATFGIHEKSTEEIVNMMVGRNISQVYQRNPNLYSGESLRVEGLCDYKEKVKHADLVVNKGEIVGLAGLVGAGRTELANLIFGIDRRKAGKVYLYGEEVLGKITPGKMVRRHIGFVCEDRKSKGLALKDSVAWNITAVSLRQLFPHGLIRYKKIKNVAESYRERLKIAVPTVQRPCKFLSGGNQQKVVLAKWLSAHVDILILDEPTRGIDMGAKMEIYELMNQLSLEGKSILLISSELPELIGMSDRIYVVHEGRIVHECKRGSAEFNAEDIGAMMLNVYQDAEGKAEWDE